MRPERPRQPAEQSFVDSYRNLYEDSFKTLSAELNEGDLRPYQDSQMLQRRLNGGNRSLRHFPELAQAIDDALLAEDDQSLIDTAQLLYDAEQAAKPVNQRPVNNILSYITLANGAGDRKNEALGLDAPTSRLNAMMYLLCSNMVRGVQPEDIPTYYISSASLEYFTKEMERKGATPPGSAAYVCSKLKLMNFMLLARYYTQVYANNLPRDERPAPTVEQIQADSAEVAASFKLLREQQAYGLKPAYKKHPLGGSLILSRPYIGEISGKYSHLEYYHPLINDTPAIAEAIHSGKSHHKRLKPVEVHNESLDVAMLSYADFEILTTCFVGPSGELYTDAQCRLPAMNIFISAGRYDAYRRLQADIIGSYFDMTQATETVVRAGRNTTEAQAIGSSARESGMEVFRKLVVPRIKAISDGEHTTAERRQDDTVTGSSVIFQNVTWHRRRLPDGWSPTPRALEFARQAGISLRPGETFVRDHNRGIKALGEVVGHQLVERPDHATTSG